MVAYLECKVVSGRKKLKKVQRSDFLMRKIQRMGMLRLFWSTALRSKKKLDRWKRC
jgi:hypothetical protein